MKRALNPGDMADPAAAVVEVADTRHLNLTASLTSDSIKNVRAGMTAHIISTDIPGVKLEGRVISVGQVDPQTNLLPVRITVPNHSGLLKAGGFASAAIVLRRNLRTVVVPKEAIVTKEGKTFVFVMSPDGVAHQKDATIGTEQNGLAEVLSGVTAGDKVITEGQYELPDGAKVILPGEKPAESKPESGKKAGD
jgi:membrane fusion protein (multidrug efflux system)